MRRATCLRASAVIGGVFGWALAGSCAAQLPVGCKVPESLAAALRRTPTAPVYDSAGAFFAQRNQLPCAVAAFEKAVQAQPGSPEAQYNLGLAYATQKQVAPAEQHLRLAIQADPHLQAAHNALGTLLLDNGKPAEAEVEFRRVVEIDPSSVQALDNLGMALAAEQRYSAAIRVWNQALALAPDSPQVSLSLAVAMYKDGQQDAAAAMLRTLTAAHPDRPDAQFTLGNMLAHALLYPEAARHYAEVLRLDPKQDAARLAYAKALSNSGSLNDSLAPGEEYVRHVPADPEGHLVLGSIYRKQTEYAKAEVQLRMVVDARPNDAQANYELGMALFREEHPDQARPYLERAYALQPADSPTAFALATVLRRVGDTKRAGEITDAMLRDKEKERTTTTQSVAGGQANAFLVSGEPAKAVEMYRRMLAAEPDNARTEYNLALALAATHDIAGEREALQAAIHLDPKMAVAESELGMLDLAGGDLAGAEQKLTAALAIDPQAVAAEGNLGLVYAMRGDGAGAERLFRQAVEDDPKYVQGYMNLGLLLASRGNFQEAASELQTARTLAPDDAKVISALGKVEARLGHTDEALTLFRRNAALSPKLPEAHIELAIALADSFDLKDALAEADAATSLAPNLAAAHYNRGRILFDLGRGEEAKASLERACTLAPALADPHYFLALVEKQAGHNERAAELLRTVIQAQPRNVSAWYFLGQSLQRSDPPGAVAAWKQTLAISGEYTPALWSLTRTLAASDPERPKYAAQLQVALAKAHSLDEAEMTANNAIAAMQAHDWPEALKGMQNAIAICGECSAKASLHKSLGLAYCHAGDLANGEKELRLSESLAAGDPEVQRALLLIARAKTMHG